jgi:hypothetical protein
MNKSLLLLLAPLALGACAIESAGTGSGNVRGTQKPVAFTWESDDSRSGDITATFNSGRVFKGSYVQITRNTRGDSLEPLWYGWDSPTRHGDWRYWEDDPGAGFYRTYDGRVLANLHAENGEHMRCRFTLLSPSQGMAGGGAGRCQMSDSTREINAEFPRQS